MQTVELDEIRVASALDTDASADGVSFRRLPAWTRPQITDIAHELAVTAPAGVRLELVTDARRIELDVLTFRLELNGRPALPAVFDLVVDGELVASEATDAGVVTCSTPTPRRSTSGSATRHRRLRSGRRTGRRPSRSGCRRPPRWSCAQLRVSDGATVAAPDERRRRWIHHGSSISHCVEATQPTGTWPAIVARRAGRRSAEPGLRRPVQPGPDGRPDHPRPARRPHQPQGRASTSSTPTACASARSARRCTASSTPSATATRRRRSPWSPPIICPMVEDHPGPTPTGADHAFYAPARPTDLALGALTLQRTRELAAAVVAARRDAGDENLHLIDGLRLFGPDDAEGLYDGLHPTSDGYRLIGDRFHALAFEGSGPFASVAR